jgi:hypothetical protein
MCLELTHDVTASHELLMGIAASASGQEGNDHASRDCQLREHSSSR